MLRFAPYFTSSTACAMLRKMGEKVYFFKSNKIKFVCQLITKPRKDQTSPIKENWVQRFLASAVANSRPKGKQDKRKFTSKLLK